MLFLELIKTWSVVVTLHFHFKLSRTNVPTNFQPVAFYRDTSQALNLWCTYLSVVSTSSALSADRQVGDEDTKQVRDTR